MACESNASSLSYLPMPEDVRPLSDHDREVLEAEPDTPRIYFNGFVNGLTQGDVRIGLTLNGKTVGHLSCSFTLAKTLSTKLGALVEALEKATGQTIMTVDEIKIALEGKGKDKEPVQ